MKNRKPAIVYGNLKWTLGIDTEVRFRKLEKNPSSKPRFVFHYCPEKGVDKNDKKAL
jgi:hypothetical protein